MRRPIPIALTALLSATASARAEPPAQPNEAEQLLRKLDEKIAAAKTLRIEFEVRTPPEAFNQTITGMLAVGERNQFRYELKSSLLGDVLLVGDGKRMGGEWPWPVENRAAPAKTPLPAWHNEVLREWLGRGGILNSMIAMSQFVAGRPTDRPGPADGPRVSNVKLLTDEEVDGVKARVVAYDLTWRAFGTPDAAKMRVWIDAKTKLPLRRTMTVKLPALGQPSAKDAVYTAVHMKFEINPKLDDKLFELPK